MSSALQDFLLITSVIAFQLIGAVVFAALFTSGLFLRQIWTRQRLRIDGHQRRLDLLVWRILRLTDVIEAIEARLDRHLMVNADFLPADALGARARPAFPRPPFDIFNLNVRLDDQAMDPLDTSTLGQKVSTSDSQAQEEKQLSQKLQHFGYDGQHEWQPDSNTQPTLGTKVIRTTAARRSREIAEAVDPQSYGINPQPSTSSDDDEDSPLEALTLQSDLHDDSLSGTTLCEGDGQPGARVTERDYQQRPHHHFGYYDYADEDDPFPALPHPHWVGDDGCNATATTTVGSAPGSAVTRCPPFSFAGAAAEAEHAEHARASSFTAHPHPRIGARFRRDEHATGNEAATQIPNFNISSPSSPWTPPSSTAIIEAPASTSRLWQPSVIREEDAAHLHNTPRQWPEPAHGAIEADRGHEHDEINEFIPEYEREYAQHQADEFNRRYPGVARLERRSGMRGGGGGKQWPRVEKEASVEDGVLLDRSLSATAQCVQDVLRLEQEHSLGCHEERRQQKCPCTGDHWHNEPRAAELVSDEQCPGSYRAADSFRVRHCERNAEREGQPHVANPYEFMGHGARHTHGRRGDEIRAAAPTQDPMDLSRDPGLHHYPNANAHQDTDSFNFHSHPSRFSAGPVPAREECYETSHQRQAELEQQCAFGWPDQRLNEWYTASLPSGSTLQSRGAPVWIPSRHRPYRSAPYAVREAQGLDRCTCIDGHPYTLRTAIPQNYAQMAVDQAWGVCTAAPTYRECTETQFPPETRSLCPCTTAERMLVVRAGNTARANRGFEVGGEERCPWCVEFPRSCGGGDHHSRSW